MKLIRYLGSFLRFQTRLFFQLLLGVTILAGWCLLQRESIGDYLNSLERYRSEKALAEEGEVQVDILEREREELSRGDGARSEAAVRDTYHLSKPDEEVLYLDSPPSSSDGAAPKTD